jgi:hypothetical protein
LNKFTPALVATLLCGVSALAQANTTYSAGFALEGSWLPNLRTGSPAWDGPDSLGGAWAQG